MRRQARISRPAAAAICAAAALWVLAGAAPGALLSAPETALAAPAAMAAAAPRLAWPLDCRNGVDCVVQQYPDLDPGPGALDPGCGGRTYDGHEGVDIRVRTLRDLARGVTVRAAADGQVLRVRDQARLRRGQHCGVGVVIAHAGGLETQYCHLEPGQTLVRPGEAVRAGDPIGRLGLTGRTTFPHLHLTVRRDGAPVDPFTGAAVGQACGRAKGDTLWRDATLAYEPAAFLDAGFSDRAPSYARLLRGEGVETATTDADRLVFWTRALGVEAGDRFEVRLRGPGGARIARHAERLAEDRAVQFLYTGRTASPRGWPPGRYVGRARLIRGGAAILDRRWTIDLRGPQTTTDSARTAISARIGPTTATMKMSK